MSKQTEYRQPAPGTALNTDEFQHELTQIYLELKDSFTRARLRKNHPAPQVPESHLNPNVKWKSSDVKLKAFAAPKARLANIAEFNPELKTDRVIAPPEIHKAKISKREWKMKEQSVPALPRAVANTKWEKAEPKWSRPVPPEIASAKIRSTPQIQIDLSNVTPPEKAGANVEWKARKLNLKEPKPVTRPVMAKNTGFSEFKLNIKKKPNLVAIITAKTDETLEFLLEKAYDRPARPVPANITEVQKSSPQIKTIAPVSVHQATVRKVSISAAPVNIVPVGCRVAKITPVSAAKSKIENSKQISVRCAHIQKWNMQNLGTIPAVQITVPDASEADKHIAPITSNIPRCHVYTVMASTNVKKAQIEAPVPVSVDVRMASAEPKKFQIEEPKHVSVDTHVASTALQELSVPLPMIQKTPMISANIPSQINLFPNDQPIPKFSVTIYKNPEAPDLGLPKIREIQPAVQPTFMDAMAVWESMGGPEAFARDGFTLNHIKR